MNFFVYHILAGHALLAGITLFVFAAVCSWSSSSLLPRVGNFACVIGLIAILFSSTPIPYLLYVLGIASSIILLWNRRKRIFGLSFSYVPICIWLLAGIFDLPYHIFPTLQIAMTRQIAIVGDSVTAGIGGDETSETWPNILATKHNVEVLDLSRAGATAKIALGRLPKNQINAPIVIIEIGGNDILGGTSYKDFASYLDALVSQLIRKDRQILMFELPLPPFSHEYGRIQRRVASKYGVLMLPRRALLSVLADKDSVLDIVHLSKSGHERMAALIWQLLRPAFDDESPT